MRHRAHKAILKLPGDIGRASVIGYLEVYVGVKGNGEESVDN